MATKGHEKRSYLRFPVALPVDFGQRDHYLSTMCCNLSQEGIFVETSQDFKHGERVCLFIYLPNTSDPIKAIGEVMWISTIEKKKDIDDKPVNGVGIKFINGAPENADLMKGMINANEDQGARLFAMRENELVL